MRRENIRDITAAWPRAAILAVTLGFCMVALIADGSAQAELRAGGGPIAFNIPAQPLVDALDAFGAQADLQVLYESALAQDRRSAPVIGQFTREDALRQLLAQTGLTASYADGKNVILHLASSISAATDATPAFGGSRLTLETLRVEAVSGPDFRAYDGVIALDLQKALRRNAKTRNGDYSVNAKIWIGSEGNVWRAELARSTGDKIRDDAVLHTLQNLVVSRSPPDGLPEPVTVSIIVKPL